MFACELHARRRRAGPLVSIAVYLELMHQYQYCKCLLYAHVSVYIPAPLCWLSLDFRSVATSDGLTQTHIAIWVPLRWYAYTNHAHGIQGTCYYTVYSANVEPKRKTQPVHGRVLTTKHSARPRQPN